MFFALTERLFSRLHRFGQKDHSSLAINAAALVIFFLSIGATPADLTKVWFYPTDLMGWYEKSLAIISDGSQYRTYNLGFPSQYKVLGAEALSLDFVQHIQLFLYSQLLHNPILAVNLFLISQLVLTVNLAKYLLKFFVRSPILVFIGSLSIGLAPATLVRIDKPNISSSWPYLAALILVLVISGDISPKRRNLTIVLTALLISGSGGYSIVFIFIGIFVPFVSFVLLPKFRRREIESGPIILASAVGILFGLFQVMLWLLTANSSVSFPARASEEAFFFQGWNLSQFLPSNLSFLPGVRQLGQWIYNSVFLSADGGSFCLGRIDERDRYMGQLCQRITEVLAFPSFLALVGSVASLIIISNKILVIANPGFSKSLREFPGTRGMNLLIAFGFWNWMVGSFGFGLLIASVIPSVRMWGRLGLLSTTMSTVVAITLIERGLIRFKGRANKRRLIIAVTIIAVLLDQGLVRFDAVAKHRNEQRSVQHISVLAESLLPKECSVVTLPSRQFGHGDVRNWTTSYHEYRDSLFALYAPSLRFSGGVGEGVVERAPESLVNSFGSSEFSTDFFSEFAQYLVHARTCAVLQDSLSGSRTSSPWFRERLIDQFELMRLQIRVFVLDEFSLIILDGPKTESLRN